MPGQEQLGGEERAVGGAHPVDIEAVEVLGVGSGELIGPGLLGGGRPGRQGHPEPVRDRMQLDVDRGLVDRDSRPDVSHPHVASTPGCQPADRTFPDQVLFGLRQQVAVALLQVRAVRGRGGHGGAKDRDCRGRQ